MEMIKRLFSLIDQPIDCQIKDSKIRIEVETPTFFHNHNAYEMLLILNGNLKMFMDNQSIIFSPGDLVLIPPYTYHGGAVLDSTKDLYQRIVISIQEDMMASLSSVSSDLSECFYKTETNTFNYIHLNEDQLKRYITIAHDLNGSQNQSQFGNDILTKAYIIQLLVEINRMVRDNVTPTYQNHVPSHVRKVLTYIDTHLTETITLNDIASYTHHNATYINRLFKQNIGLPIQQFIIVHRISLAQKLLRENASPSDACYLSGFNNYSHFSRSFTNTTGMSPRKYQLMVQKNLSE